MKTNAIEVEAGVIIPKSIFLECRIHDDILKIAKDEFGLARGRVLVSRFREIAPELRAAIEEAESRGSINEEETDNLHVADVLIRARRISDRKYLYAVGEVAYNVRDDSIERARSQANALATVTGDEVIAIVIGGMIQPPQRALAELNNVQVVIPAMLEQEP